MYSRRRHSCSNITSETSTCTVFFINIVFVFHKKDTAIEKYKEMPGQGQEKVSG